eukprot:CAMPEP_0194280458 /NCGR_PEP_ID=MMETSP0169-20130528/17398_1 /TAXON_ID=218684 /ORGANISM="Corethron pennatum, Strain L29A3" /LENGTH=184 /DNA_ID=CAMNT_0039025177 /DNA_START=127 /DNA_END=678 /DNA_ORIENTATION=-
MAVNNCGKQTSSSCTSGRRDAFAAMLASLPVLTTAGLPFPASAESATTVDAPTFLDGPRGLRYTILKAGSGPTPVRAQKVKTNYVLTLNGFKGESAAVKEIDSSTGFLKGPFSFRVGVSEVIKGWDLAVMDMRAGEKRRLVIPADIGYGAKGAGGAIPGGATLYFEVELLELLDIPILKENMIQ